MCEVEHPTPRSNSRCADPGRSVPLISGAGGKGGKTVSIEPYALCIDLGFYPEWGGKALKDGY